MLKSSGSGYEHQWNHSQKDKPVITVAANDLFVYSIWEEEKYIQMAITKKRREDEEVRSGNVLIYKRVMLYPSST